LSLPGGKSGNNNAGNIEPTITVPIIPHHTASHRRG
jgi:hypothetical protein